MPLVEIDFIREAATMNQALADEGLQGYGLRIGKILTDQVERKLLSDDLMTLAMRLSSAASDARMDGAMLPAMSNSGSGNQGIAATMPVVAAARFLKADDEQLARALVMSHLVAIYIKAYQNKLSALCAASTAAMGSGPPSPGCWGQFEQISHCINNMIGDVSGIICDGAGSACSMKVRTSTSAAVKSSLMAINNLRVPQSEGDRLGRCGSDHRQPGSSLQGGDAGYRHRDHQHHAGQAAGWAPVTRSAAVGHKNRSQWPGFHCPFATQPRPRRLSGSSGQHFSGMLGQGRHLQVSQALTMISSAFSVSTVSG